MAEPGAVQKILKRLAAWEAECFVQKSLQSFFGGLKPFLPRNGSGNAVFSHAGNSG
jgi:hypothetical protein